MNPPLQIVHVEDSAEDCEFVKHMLEESGQPCEIKRVETRAELVDALSGTRCDLVLSDCTLPQFSGLEALEITLALRPQVPFVFFSGTIGEETAIESLRNGATDYVLKHNLTRLVPAVRRALSQTEEQATRRKLERRLHQARRLQAVTTLAGNIARDVDRLLLNVRGYASSLAEELPPSPRAREIITRLRQTAEEGSELMQQLLAFARRRKASFIGIEMLPFLRQAADDFKSILPGQIEIELRVAPDLPRIFADPEHLHRMLTNLVFNARDAMPSHGRITLSAEIVKFDPIPSHAPEIEDAPYLALRVADNGTGMDEATRLRIFEPFFTTKPLGHGSGLGLPEVFGLMRIHNGFIDVQSEPSNGSLVSLYFPLPRNSWVFPENVTKIAPIQMPEVTAPM